MKLIAIAGSGRTGSTLLSVLLSQGAGVFNLGQLRDLWAAYLHNAPCTCGSRLQSCAVWSTAVTQAFGAKPEASLQLMHQRMIRFAESAVRLQDWSDTVAVAKLASEHADYVHGLQDFLLALKAVTGATAFVDASKSPELGLAFSQIEGIDFRVLNLVRDPRAVASSWLLKRDEKMALRQSKTWLMRQLVLARWSRALGRRFSLLRYEDFAARPRTLVGQLLHWAGLDSVPGLFTTEARAELSWASQHLYPPANEKFIEEKRTSVEIVEATGWRNAGHEDLHRQVEMIVKPILARFGYVTQIFSDPAVGGKAIGSTLESTVAAVSASPALLTTTTGVGKSTQYVFLICSERSGSNLISTILNSHPEIGAPPPYHLCRDIGLNWHALIGASLDSATWMAITDAIAQRLSKMRSPGIATDFRRWLEVRRAPSFGELAHQIFGELSGIADKRLIFVKENNLHRMLFFVLQHFPDAKFVFQVRDPRDYLLSAMNRKDGVLGNKFGSSLRALEIWREDQLGGLSALAHLGSERVFFQRYEDLLSRPESVLSALCDFLGVDFDPRILDFHQTDYAQKLAVPGGPRENLSKPLMSENFAKYREGLSVEQVRIVEIYLGDLMDRFGYQRDHVDTATANRYELFWPMFLEPVERFFNGETAPFYTDGAAKGVTGPGMPLQPVYGEA